MEQKELKERVVNLRSLMWERLGLLDHVEEELKETCDANLVDMVRTIMDGDYEVKHIKDYQVVMFPVVVHATKRSKKRFSAKELLSFCDAMYKEIEEEVNAMENVEDKEAEVLYRLVNAFVKYLETEPEKA